MQPADIDPPCSRDGVCDANVLDGKLDGGTLQPGSRTGGRPIVAVLVSPSVFKSSFHQGVCEGYLRQCNIRCACVNRTVLRRMCIDDVKVRRRVAELLV